MCEQPSTPQGSKAQTPSTLSSTPWREAPKISAPNLGVGNYAQRLLMRKLYMFCSPRQVLFCPKWRHNRNHRRVCENCSQLEFRHRLTIIANEIAMADSRPTLADSDNFV